MLLFHSHLHCVTYLLLLAFFPQHYSTCTYLPFEPKIYRHKYSFHASFYYLSHILPPSYLLDTIRLSFSFTLLQTIIDIYTYIYTPQTTSDCYKCIRLEITTFLVFYDQSSKRSTVWNSLPSLCNLAIHGRQRRCRWCETIIVLLELPDTSTTI